MHSDLLLRRRVLEQALHAYVAADRAWREGARAARQWFPPEVRPQLSPIGDPGSRLRRLYDTRERALLRMLTAREKLDIARRRHAARRERSRVVLMLQARSFQ